MRAALIPLYKDINKGYEQLMSYRSIDKLALETLWWNFGALVVLSFTNSYLRLSEIIHYPFSWRVIPKEQAILASFLGVVSVLLIQFLLHNLKNHYLFRIVLTLSMLTFSFLYIFITGGAISGHFHIFLTMAFVSIYADWRLGVVS